MVSLGRSNSRFGIWPWNQKNLTVLESQLRSVIMITIQLCNNTVSVTDHYPVRVNARIACILPISCIHHVQHNWIKRTLSRLTPEYSEYNTGRSSIIQAGSGLNHEK